MKHFVFIKADGTTSGIVGKADVLTAAGKRLDKGQGPFLLLKNGEGIGHENTRLEALVMLDRQLSLDTRAGDTFRFRDVDVVLFACRAVELAAEVIDTSGNDKIDKIWTDTLAEFGKDNVLFMGALVCKLDSQHRFGNAIDMGNKNNPKIYDMANWAIKNRGTYSIRNVIVGTRINHLGVWSPYTGVPHTSHVHIDCEPNFDTSLPCGLRG